MYRRCIRLRITVMYYRGGRWGGVNFGRARADPAAFRCVDKHDRNPNGGRRIGHDRVVCESDRSRVQKPVFAGNRSKYGPDE